MIDTVRMSLDEAHRLALSALVHKGFSAAQAGAIADTVIAAERDECTSHGLFRIPLYVKALQNPDVDPRAEPVLHDLAPGVLHVDARYGFAPLGLKLSAEPLADKARKNGVAALAINNAYHIAALWPELEHLADKGLVAFAFTAGIASVAPAGGTKPVYGTNPMGFSWPRKGRPPMVFDQASSVAARGEIQLHLRDGKPLPAGWALGPDGEPTTDPEAALRGAQLAFGGHKGAAIALMVELLAGALVGDVFSYEAKARDTGTGAPLGGELLLAIDPARLVRGGDASATLERAEALFAKILEQDGTRLPSDRRFAARARTPKDGIVIPTSLHDAITEIAST